MKSYLHKYSDLNDLKAKALAYFKDVHGDTFNGGAVIVYNGSFTDHRNCGTAYYAAYTAARYIKSTGTAYVTINQFDCSPAGTYRRSSKSLYGIPAIVIDIDKIDKSRGSMSRSELLGFLRNEKHLSQIPEPNFAVETGSGGYHLYYLLERLPGSMQESVQALKLALHERFIRLEDGHDHGEFTFNLRVDLACMDISRLIRVPGSFHEDTMKQAEMISIRKKRYTYRELADKLLPPSWNYDYLMSNLNRSILNIRMPKRSTVIARSRFRIGTPEALAERRIQELLRLADSGYRFPNCRELACFILWNNALILRWNETTIAQALRRLNKCFHAPLSERELFRCARTKRHYKMTNVKIRALLNLEDDYTDFFCGKRRSKGRKALTQLHMRLIASLVKAGKSISKIAKELALSISLVKRRRAQMMREHTLEFYSTAASSLPAVA